MACHTFNLPFMALDLRDPTSRRGGIVLPGRHRDRSTATCSPSGRSSRFAFPARGKRPAVKVVWYDGGKLPPAELFGKGVKPAKSGSLLVGDKGSLYSPGDNGDQLQAARRHRGAEGFEYAKSPGHFAELVRAIRGGPEAVSNFPDYAGPLTETILLGNLAVSAGRKVEWDAKKMKAKGACRRSRN